MSDNDSIIYKIKELDIDMINPTTKSFPDNESSGTKTIVIGKPGCFTAGTKIMMYNGEFKNVENVKVGDQVMGDDSTPRNVLELCNNEDEMFDIIPHKGEKYTVNKLHKLVLKFTSSFDIYKKNETIEITVEDYLKSSETFKDNTKIFKTKINFDEKNILIDPYLLGLYLCNDKIYNSIKLDTEIKNYLDNINISFDIFKNYNLFNNKHIPLEYKINSRKIRLELLAGILDIDGSYDKKNNCYYFTNKNEKFFDDVLFIVRSLGFSGYKNKIEKSDESCCFKCYIFGNVNDIPCKVIRKQARERKNTKNNLISRFEVKSVGNGEYFGFTLDGNHRFLLSTFDVVRNTGKTTLISSLLYAKKHIFPVAMAMSGSEDSNNHYKTIIPSTFVFNDYDPEQVKSFIKRQKIARMHLENPWAILLLDDCTDDPKIFNSKLQHSIFKKGRHWCMWYILSLQYSMDVKPVIRTNVDGIFILRESILKNRENLWRNYAGIIPDFKLFCDIMDVMTDDYTALYIHNTGTSNNWTDCVYWYKAPLVPKDFKFGSKDYWDFHYKRYNPEYTDPFDV